MDYPLALYSWSALSILAGLISAWLLAKIVMRYHPPEQHNCYRLFVYASVIIFGYFPSFSNIIYGQLGLLLLLLFVLAWLLINQQQEHYAGILFGIAFSIKIFIGLFLLLFLLRRQWRLLAWFVGTFILCNIAALSVFGIDCYLEYYQILHFIKWYASSWNASWFGFCARLLGINEGNIPLWQAPWLTPILHKVGAFILLLGLWRLAQPNIQQRMVNPSATIDFAYTLVAMLLISPLGWLYYFPLLLIVFGAIFLLYHQQAFAPYLYCLTICAALLSNLPQALVIPNYIKQVSFSLTWASFYSYALILLAFILFKIGSTPTKQHYPIANKVIVLSIAIVWLPSVVSILMYAINNPMNNVLDQLGVIGYTY